MTRGTCEMLGQIGASSCKSAQVWSQTQIKTQIKKKVIIIRSTMESLSHTCSRTHLVVHPYILLL